MPFERLLETTRQTKSNADFRFISDALKNTTKQQKRQSSSLALLLLVAAVLLSSLLLSLL